MNRGMREWSACLIAVCVPVEDDLAAVDARWKDQIGVH